MAIAYKALWRKIAFIGGQWVDGRDGNALKIATFPVINPANGQVLAQVADCSVQQAEQAVESASQALISWSTSSVEERSQLLRRWGDLMRQHQRDLAEIISLENGKPLEGAQAEVDYALACIDYYASLVHVVGGDIIPASTADERMMVIRQPIGVVLAITPWNFPLSLVVRKIATALAAGCTIILKPSEKTPMTALAAGLLLDEAGLPSGVLNIVTTQHAEHIVPVWMRDERVRKISFTGSTAVGKKLIEYSSLNVKKLSLELGGNAPFIIFPDADLHAALDGLMTAKLRNSGQACVSINRLLLHDKIYDDMVQQLNDAFEFLRVRDGLSLGADVGPLINQAAMDKIDYLIADAVKRGARVIRGGKPHPLTAKSGGFFYEPTLIADATPDMAIFSEEIFGPVLVAYRFHNEVDAIDMANRSSHGLAGYVYTSNLGRAVRVAEALECGMVGINSGRVTHTAQAPMGGVKQSGYGKEGGVWGLDEFTTQKLVVLKLDRPKV